MSNIKIKGLRATVKTDCIVVLEDGEATFKIEWRKPKVGGEKEALIKELTRGERKMFRQQAEASVLIKGQGEDIPQEFFDVLDQTEDMAEQYTNTIITSLKNYLVGWHDLTGEDEKEEEVQVPFSKEALDELLTDADWQKGIVDSYRGLLGIRKKEREEKAKN